MTARFTRADVVAVAALIAFGVVMPVVIALAAGAIDVSHNDDFAHRRIALDLFQSGQVRLIGWSVMSLVGQLVAVQPFLWLTGGSPAAFVALTALLAAVAIVAGYVLASELLPGPLAFVAVLLVLLCPGLLLYTTTFMTDVPAYAAEILCLALGAIALRSRGRRQWAWLIASLLAGVFAFSIREFGLAAPAAVLVVVTAKANGSRIPFLVAGGVTAVACLAIHQYTTDLPGQGSLAIGFSDRNIEQIRQGAVSVGLAVSPVVALVLIAGRRPWRWPDFSAGVLVGILAYRDVFAIIADERRIPTLLLGNTLGRVGTSGGVGAGFRPPLFGPPIWDILCLIGFVSLLLLLGMTTGAGLRLIRSNWRRGPRRWLDALATPVGLLVTFIALYGGGSLALALIAPAYDRYLWPLTLPITCLLLTTLRPDPEIERLPSRARGVSAVVAAAVLGGTLAWAAMAVMLNGLAFDVAGWRMGEAAVARGYHPGTVDAGMAWVGYHADSVADMTARQDPRKPWYDSIWPSFRLCALVSATPQNVPGLKLLAVDTNAYRLFLFDGIQAPLYLYAVDDPSC